MTQGHSIVWHITPANLSEARRLVKESDQWSPDALTSMIFFYRKKNNDGYLCFAVDRDNAETPSVEGWLRETILLVDPSLSLEDLTKRAFEKHEFLAMGGVLDQVLYALDLLQPA